MSLRKQAIALSVAAAFQPPLFAQTLPTGGQVVAGQATISQSPGHMHIQQGSDKAILNWQSFSIGTGGTVNFQQPASSSVALNRVLGNNPSQIWGHLSANGQVFLVNPSGILFAPGASVSTGGLVASTLSIADQDFLNGVYRFVNAGNAGSVVNQGVISGGYTALLGPQVTNEGLIFASLGNIALAAGDRVSLDLVGDGLIRVSVEQAALDAAVVNRGSLEAHGGQILLTARSANAILDTVINTEGFVRAVNMVERNGEIVLDGGSQGRVVAGGTVLADGRLDVAAADLSITGFVQSGGGQSVAARSLTVDGRDGRFAGLTNVGGDQVIAIDGGGASHGIELVADGGGGAQIFNADGPLPAGGQRIAITGADGLKLHASSGSASISVSGGDQQIAVSGGSLDVETRAGGGFAGITASGNQAIAVEHADHIRVVGDGNGFAQVVGGQQTVSITGSGRNAIEVGRAGALGLSSFNGATQSVTAGLEGQAGSITVFGPDGGTLPISSFGVRPGSGSQTIRTSGTLSVIAGSAPAGRAYGLFHDGQGDQTVVARDIFVQGGPAGAGNGAFINANGGGNQRFEVTGEIRLVGGGPGNGAGLGSALGGDQTIVGRPDIFIIGGSSSNAVIQPGQGRLQVIEAGNILLTNGENSPGNSAGVILGSLQQIDATGDVVLIARSGTGTSSGVRIGGQGPNPTNLALSVGGDLVLRGGTSGTNGAGLGSSGTVPTNRNDVSVVVAGDVILDGAVGGGGARIGSSALTPVQEGDISVTARNIVFTGTAPAAIRTLGNVELHAGEITQGTNGLILANALSTQSQGATLLDGANQVSRYTGSSATGDIRLKNDAPLLSLGDVLARGALAIESTGDIEIRGGDGFLDPTLVRGGETVAVTTGGDLRLVGGAGHLSPAILSGGHGVDLTVGGELHLDRGAGLLSVARVQAEHWGSVIHLSFPNLESGGFTVNGVEGAVRDGQSGFFVFLSPARIGQTLILDYP